MWSRTAGFYCAIALLRYCGKKEGVYYKIFGSWREGGKWRFSSGCKLTDLIEKGDMLEWPQNSGSIYYLPRLEEDGYTYYSGNVLQGILNLSGHDGVTIERVKLSDELKTDHSL
jgi:hypothetical protein